MNAKTKCILFALLLVAANWHWSWTTLRAIEGAKITTTVNIDGASIALLACLGIFLVLSVRLCRLIRLLLDRQIRVPREAKFVSWEPVPFLVPLFFHLSGSYVTSSGEFTTTVTSGYGSDAGLSLFVFAAILFAVYQFGAGLQQYAGGPESGIRRGEQGGNV
ncbi:MAG: hypothetical protein PHQ12_01625 [Chthoniobacteraceae bacterium]|nr:hypothetical protein [Chthoniobacteraceae bacterium]